MSRASKPPRPHLIDSPHPNRADFQAPEVARGLVSDMRHAKGRVDVLRKREHLTRRDAMEMFFYGVALEVTDMRHQLSLRDGFGHRVEPTTVRAWRQGKEAA